MLAGDCTSTVTATDCLPVGRRPAAPGSSVPAAGPSAPRSRRRRAASAGAWPGPVRRWAARGRSWEAASRPARPAGFRGPARREDSPAVPDPGHDLSRLQRSWARQDSGPHRPAQGRPAASARWARRGGASPAARPARPRASADRLRPGREPSPAPATPVAGFPGTARIAGPWIDPLLGNGPGDSASVETDRLKGARTRQAGRMPPPSGWRTPGREPDPDTGLSRG